MPWIKVPEASHDILTAALPKDPRVRTMRMFGGTAALVNGNMFGGTFARSVIVKVGDDDMKQALALDGAEPFDPMGNGRVMANTVLMPETLMDEPEELRSWLRRALDYTGTLPPKQKKGNQTPKKKGDSANRAAVAKPAKKPAAKTPTAKKPAKKSSRFGEASRSKSPKKPAKRGKR